MGSLQARHGAVVTIQCHAGVLEQLRPALHPDAVAVATATAIDTLTEQGRMQQADDLR